jgi:hypothetical protein
VLVRYRDTADAEAVLSRLGGTAIDRWLRPVTFQTVPPELLSAELAQYGSPTDR